ncbi:hypothetical protein BK133_14335 [Paenibacillus sp. FSL H8-0548]|uniref:hypothetical protein n=1 Tax=Paenibacillus sp. FSL H8-0548 TaxID=1920422 RepID=UPI00096D50A3|nr:hypothetical protein [Paenibacillus sp. FSL H8-0548]OMF32199.1 hypothetical protein BK133_14335 [Paenibacillus sp. FSL H8-0548]
MMNMRKNGLLGHLIRWLLLLLSFFIIFKAMSGNSGFRLEKVIQTELNNMETPAAPIATRTKIGHGYELLQMVDHEHGLYHNIFVKRSLGFIWSHHGGSVMPLDPQILLSFKGGYSTFGKNRHYYYAGELNDPQISRLQVTWWDGLEQNAEIKDGVYQAARSVRNSDEGLPQFKTGRLSAYDAQGQLLYELDDEHREIRVDTDTGTDMDMDNDMNR